MQALCYRRQFPNIADDSARRVPGCDRPCAGQLLARFQRDFGALTAGGIDLVERACAVRKDLDCVVVAFAAGFDPCGCIGIYHASLCRGCIGIAAPRRGLGRRCVDRGKGFFNNEWTNRSRRRCVWVGSIARAGAGVAASPLPYARLNAR